MKRKMIQTISIVTMTLLLGASFVGCTKAQNRNENAVTTQTADTKVASSDNTAVNNSSANVASKIEGSLNTSEMFSDQDLEQSADLATRTQIELESGKDVILDKEGVYVLSGEVKNVTVTVEAAEDAKIQIVLDGVSITNEDSPAIYVKTADKVFVTSTNSKNHMEVSGQYAKDGDTNLDAVIYSKADMTLNGTGTLEVVSRTGNGITSKDDLKITGGAYTIDSAADGIEAKDAILVYDGAITIVTDKDALHSENEEDASLGYIYIKNGTLNITASDDAIRANSIVQIDGGTLNIDTCEEGMEATNIEINGGEITMFAKNDGINATPKISNNAAIEVNGGTINVTMGDGDTDAFDSNGNICINGGTITVEAGSAFDSDGTAELNGGDVTVNGEKITEITQQQMGGKGKRK
ncbi:carbohydrate-binding domain-containing protein [Clostridium sp.]|uniref:carbohydrate-binding domain-containing protein n=1 Tax=Clostridium sp. TaxID=1506 RepID=UPI002FCB6A9F